MRGIGLGFTMMPAMAAAYSTLERWQVPRATPMLNVVQRVGGSLGTAVLAVVLAAPARRTRPARRRRPAVASAFAHTYWWAMAITAVALVPAIVLAHAQRTADRGRRGRTPVSARANVA